MNHHSCGLSSVLCTALTFLALAVAVPAFAGSPPAYADALDSFLRDTVRRYRIPGCAVAVVDNEGIAHEFYSGEARLGVPIDRNSSFYLGSTTKMFTALAVMNLVKTGKLELDAPVKTYLPEFRLAGGTYENMISVRHLLNHTSGLTDGGMKEPALGRNSLEEELAALANCTPAWAPGVKFAYFNVNYRLLGLIVERVGGKRFGEYLDETVLRPLSMTSTTAGTGRAADLVPAHVLLFGFPFAFKQKFRPGALPSGFLVSCTADISKFLIDELRSGRDEPGILDRSVIRETWTVPGDPEEGYGMGWVALRKPGEPFAVGSGGALEGYQSFFYLCPERNIGFVMLVNQGGLLPIIAGSGTLRDGIIAVLSGDTPKRGPGNVPGIVIASVFLAALALAVFRLVRLRAWKRKAAAGTLKVPIPRIIADFAVSLFLLTGFIPVMNAAMGSPGSWEILMFMVPELFLIIVLLILSGFLAAGLKTRILVRNAVRHASNGFPNSKNDTFHTAGDSGMKKE